MSAIRLLAHKSGAAKSSVAFFLAVFAALMMPHLAFARSLPPDAEIRQRIIAESIASYKAAGHSCACPYDSARNGSSCGRRSAYSRPGGAAPLCYPADVTESMVNDWRNRN